MGTKIASAYVDIGADTSKLEDGLRRTKTGLSDLSKSTKKSQFSFTELNSALSLVQQGLGAVKEGADAVLEFGKAGAELDYTAGKFDRLAASIGTTSDALLTDLKTATKGMISDAGLMASAGDLMALGLVKTHDEAVRLTKVAGALGMDMNQLVLTLTNQTTMRFDALGVSVDGFDEKVQKLKDSGMSASDAFGEAFLQQAEEQLARVGDKADSTAAAYQRLEAAQENLANQQKQLYGPALAYMVEQQAEMTENTNKSGSAWMQYVPILQQGHSVFQLIKAVLPETTKEIEDNTGAIEAWGNRYTAQADEIARATEIAEQATRNYAASVDRLAYDEEHASEEGWSMVYFLRENKAALEEAAAKAAEYKTQVENMQAATANLLSAQADFNQTFGDKTVSKLQAAELSGDDYEAALAAIDEQLGTNYLSEKNANDELDRAIEAYKKTGDIQAFTEALGENQTAWEELDADLQAAKAGFDEARGAWNDFLTSLKSADGMHITVTVDAVAGTVGKSGGQTNRGGQKVGGDMTDADFASGTTDFVVPPGYPGDTYRVGLTSGERVTVTPPGEASGAGGGVTISGPVTVIANNPDEFIRALERRAASQRRSGAYRMGQ